MSEYKHVTDEGEEIVFPDGRPGVINNVHNISDQRPHIAVYTDDGNAHVVPVELVRKWIAGILEPEPAVRRRIIREWLSVLEAGDDRT